MTRTITGKLIVVLALCVGLIYGIGAYTEYKFSSKEVLERVRVESRSTIYNVVDRLQHWLGSVESSTIFMSNILSHRSYPGDELNQMLRDMVANEDHIYGATIALSPQSGDTSEGFSPYYYRKNGAIKYVDMAKDNNRYWEEAWYSRAVAAAKPLWVEPYFDEGGAKILMSTFSVPVYHTRANGARSLYAVVTADVALADLHSYLQKLRLGDSSSSVLISREGRILSASDQGFIMQNYLDAMSSASDRETWQRSFSAASTGETLVFPIKCPTRLGQCSTWLSPLASTGWLVAVLYSQDEVLAPVSDYAIKATLIGLFTLVLMILAVSLIARRLTKPLVALAAASDSIARGEMDVPLPRAEGKDEVARLVQSFKAMKQDLKSYIADLELATAGRARLAGEMAAATQIQMSMLPQGGKALEQTPDYCLWAKVRPAKSVGGDLYTFYQRSDEQLTIAVGDVSDKGVPAALFMAKAISHIQQFEDAFKSPATGMALLNDALEQGNDNCMFVTLFFGVIQLQSLELQFASAGHTPPALLRAGTVTEISQETGPALGLVEGVSFPQNTVQLAPGDRLAIYTDGIDEAFNEQAEMFGTQRFNTQLKSSGEQSISDAGEAIFQAVDTYVGDESQSDDITLMLVDLHSPQKTGGTRQSFDCDGDTVGPAFDWLQGLLQQQPIAHGLAMELVLVAEEILTNIQKYARLPAGGTINIGITITADLVSLEFADAGIAFDPFVEGHRAPLGGDIDSAEVGGLGVHLITQLTDRQSYSRSAGKNIIRVEKHLS